MLPKLYKDPESYYPLKIVIGIKKVKSAYEPCSISSELIPVFKLEAIKSISSPPWMG